MKRSLRKIESDGVQQDDGVLLKVGDTVEFHQQANPKPRQTWRAEVVRQIRVTEEYEDKEGIVVAEVSWSAIRNYDCMVIVLGEESWGRNEDIRPTLKSLPTRP